jgi:hypothetical protein
MQHLNYQDIQLLNERLHALRQEAAQARLVPRQPNLLVQLWKRLHQPAKPQPAESGLPIL